MRQHISNCYSTGIVTGWDRIIISWRAGGSKYDGNISNCYSTGDVTGGNDSYTRRAGGMEQGNISNCYSTGNVTGGNDSEYLGGLAGANSIGRHYQQLLFSYWQRAE